MSSASALYLGMVTHQRLRPLRHRLRYRVFSLLLDLDELPELHARLRWFSVNRANLFSFHERDHGAGSATGLADWVRGQLRAAGLPDAARIQLLTMPRVLGYAFNPISVYFCRDAGGDLSAILYQVNNTFGERHCYLLEVAPGERDGARVSQRCAKAMHVSPFLDMHMHYRFRVAAPAAERRFMSLGVAACDTAGALLLANFAARRHALGDAGLLRALATHPLLTLKVIAGIHWEALKLWIKGVPVVTRPDAAPPPITVVTSRSS